jgi:2-keto-3-deoxy-L-rhamnonate aldolase RhmA
MRNLVKEKLERGEPSIGTWVTIGHPDETMYLADMGFDWLVCDMEHSPYGVETYHFMVQSMLYARDNCMPMARVPWNDLTWIKKAMDTGATGLVIPRIETRAMAEEAIKYMKYPPMGERGAGPRLAAFRDPEYFATANEETLVVVMIETAKGVDNIDDIFSVEGVDACFVGPSDLSLDMGIHRQFTNPRFIEALEIIVKAGEEHGVAPGMHCTSGPGPTNINEALELGFRFCAIDSDASFLKSGAQRALDGIVGWEHAKPSDEVLV